MVDVEFLNSNYKKVNVRAKIAYFLALLACLLSSSCGEELGESIFSAAEQRRNEFDRWLLSSYVYAYNVDVKYRMEDIETQMRYNLAPAELGKAFRMAKLIKHAWFEAYDEVAGVDFTRGNAPRIIHLIGSSAYEGNGSEQLGTAEGGIKVTLYGVNNIDSMLDKPDQLNYYYFHVMHHEFTHILNQKKNYDVDFEVISEGSYVQGDWTQLNLEMATAAGFVSTYAASEPREDFAEIMSTYITYTEDDWNALLRFAGSAAAEVITRKLGMVRSYMQGSWGIDLEELRRVVQRRTNEIPELDLSIENIAP
jgi:substrate import-associated zinc metallohydrolase lipoprotein